MIVAIGLEKGKLVRYKPLILGLDGGVGGHRGRCNSIDHQSTQYYTAKV